MSLPHGVHVSVQSSHTVVPVNSEQIVQLGVFMTGLQNEKKRPPQNVTFAVDTRFDLYTKCYFYEYE